jgi:hypothetical protein
MQNARCLALEPQRGASIAHKLIVQGHHPWATEHAVFNDDAARQITATLEGYEVADPDLDFG